MQIKSFLFLTVALFFHILIASYELPLLSSNTMPNEIKDIYSVDKTSFLYIFEQNVTVPLKSGTGLVRCNVYRPKGEDTNVPRVPVLVTYGPYGKDIHYKEYVYENLLV